MQRFLSLCVLALLGGRGCLAVIGDAYEQSSGLSEKEKALLLDYQNQLRAKVAKGELEGNPPAADMVAMVWDDRLASDAQAWADTCTSGHNQNDQRIHKPYAVVGQNFAGNFGAKKACDEWFNEYKDFNYDSMSCSNVCGHYEQVVWANSYFMGCGFNSCGDKNIIQCHYAWGRDLGMMDGKEPTPKPYKNGQACSDCPKGHGFCMGGALCASKEACGLSETKCECNLDASACANGQFDADICECVCDAEHTGMKCDQPCEDGMEDCDMWAEQQTCEWNNAMWMWMRRDCKKTCGKCVAAEDPDHTNSGNIRMNLGEGYTGGGNEMGGGGGGGGAAAGGGGGGGGGADCTDSYGSDCEGWAAAGECEANAGWMKSNCQKSCDACGACFDSDSNCASWAEQGECEANADWMNENCKESCKAC